MFGISYWMLPLFAGCVWLGTLLGMLGTWLAEGSPSYPEFGAGQRIAYISDIGAQGLKPLFIAGSAVMVVVFDITFITERWLRHKGRLTHNHGMVDKILSVCAILASIVGAAGLILLSIFDTKHYHRVHDAMLGVFIAGYVVAAIFVCAEYQRLGIHFREHRILRASFWMKLTFIFVEVGLAVAFGVELYLGRYNVSAILEWLIALLYIFFVWSFIIDFLPATHTKHHKGKNFPPARRQDDEMATYTQTRGNQLGGPVYTSGGRYGDGSSYGSPRPMAESGRYYQTPALSNVPASKNF